MGTEVLRPQDCLTERIRVSPCRRRNYYYGNGNGNFANPNVCSSNNNHNNPRSNRKPTAVRSDRSDQRKKQSESSISKKPRSVDDIVKTYKNSSSSNKVMEKVTILRRGESLDSKIKSSETAAATVSFKKEQGNGGDLVVTSTDRLGPDPKMVSKHIRVVDLRSPVAGNCDMYAGSGFALSPSPSSLPLPTFSKKKQLPIDDSATRDLRRLLRLDF